MVEEAGEIEEKLEGGRGTFLKKGFPFPPPNLPLSPPKTFDVIESLFAAVLLLSAVS